MRKLIQQLLLLAVLLTPVLGMGEMLTSMGKSLPVDLIYFKLPKDIIFILVLLISIAIILKRGYSQAFAPFLLFLTLSTFLVVSWSGDAMISIAGIRWCLPFFLLLLLNGTIDESFMAKLAVVLSIVILLNITAQVYQMFYMKAFRGLNQFGLSGRVSGFFSNASAAGVLGCFSFYVIRYFARFGTKTKRFFLFISFLSVFISMSSTGVGIMLFILLLPYYLKSKIKPILIFVFVPLFVIISINLDNLTGRLEGSSVSSFSTRINIFLDQLSNAEFISTRFGEATNTAVNFKHNLNVKEKAFVSDSLYTSILTNYGWLISLTLLIILCWIIRNVIKSKNEGLIIYFFICFLSSFPLILTENFPLNILFSIVGAFYLSNFKKFSLKDNSNLRRKLSMA